MLPFVVVVVGVGVGVGVPVAKVSKFKSFQRENKATVYLFAFYFVPYLAN